MQCADLMKTNLATVCPDDSVQAAARIMRDRTIGFLPVCSPEGKVLGAVTDRDIVMRIVADALPASLPVGDVMTRKVVSCRPSDDLRVAERAMIEEKVSRVLCIEENSGVLRGVISLSDIAQRETAAHAAATLSEISSREVHP